MGIYSTTDPASIPPVENNFSANFFDWNYPSYYGVYCTGGNTIPGQKNYLIGAIYVGQYLLYLCMYIPSLIVISRPALFQHACYKIMFMIGLWKSGLHVCNSLKPKFCSLNSLWQCSKEYKNEPITRIIPFSNGFQVATNQHKVMIHSNSSITNETVIVPSTGIFFLSPEANSTYVLGNLTLRPTLLPLINLKAEHYENPVCF